MGKNRVMGFRGRDSFRFVFLGFGAELRKWLGKRICAWNQGSALAGSSSSAGSSAATDTCDGDRQSTGSECVRQSDGGRHQIGKFAATPASFIQDSLY